MAGKPWFRANPDLYRQVQAEILAEFPNMRSAERDGQVFLEGAFPLIEDGQVVDRFEIEVEMPWNYPVGIPAVREVIGRIKRGEEYHTHPDGRLCLFVPGERWRYWPAGAGLVKFLMGPVRSFFIGYMQHEKKGEWPFGQRGHRQEGIYEAYAEMWHNVDREEVAKRLKVLSQPLPRWRDPCPCGNKARFGKCHGEFYRLWNGRISAAEAHEAWKILDAKRQTQS